MRIPPFRKLAVAALLGSSLSVQAAAEPYLYGPVRSGEQLARIAWELRPDKTRIGTWQMTAALYRANPRSFIGGDMERLRPGAMLVVPADEDVRRVDPELARQLAREPQNAQALLGAAALPAPAAPAPAAEAAAAPAAAVGLTLAPASVPAAAPAAEPPAAATAKVVPAWAPDPSPVSPPAIPPAVPAQPPGLAAAPAPIVPPERRRPDADARQIPPDTEPLPDPNRLSRLAPVAMPEPWKQYDKMPVPDRWRILNSLGIVPQRWWDPYNQNTWKGDKPIYKNEHFVSFNATLDSVYEYREQPTPIGGNGTGEGGLVNIFGRPQQYTLASNLILSAAYIKGDTVYRPPDIELRFTPVLNYNYTAVQEAGAININPAKGLDRRDSFVGIQELFADFDLRAVSDRYDFDSIRFGIQPFSSDFRGFLFQDSQLGVRLFGTRDNNRYQYNLGWFRRLEKDTNSGLNDIGAALRDDDLFVFSLYRQDLPVYGFTSQGIVAYNRNRDSGRFYDKNGFLQRPAAIGTETIREYDVVYLGYNGDGHFGRLNLTTSAYAALGRQDRGVFFDDTRDIRGFFAAAEASYDMDWMRFRLSALYGSGDRDPYDDTASGYDAIFENPIFAGADTSFWIRRPVPLIGGGGVALSQVNGVLANLRPSKEFGQSNFENPGIVLVGVGADFDVLPQLRIFGNANYLRFDDTAILELMRSQGGIGREIGWDLSVAAIWRPFFTQNIIVRVSGAVLLPGEGFRALYPDEDGYSVLANLIFSY
ncbi:hypothetical protein C3942_10855 [Solimonas fluminis]|uniref:LysM domain-containing protein n=1 Tax=Solimonas fluminis TaxID=2086571 RepID=A0A2S5TFV6_9GAMM|nr:FimV/HubP family polar landmark protein [Solimonas fluminis]PPE73891.1 hypothetical protein C3942_10855 [Solimonas fluminis]